VIVITKVEYSKNPVSTGETFLLYVTLVEVFAIWNDTLAKTWDDMKIRTWDNLRRKIF
jgi:hypothetical protein